MARRRLEYLIDEMENDSDEEYGQEYKRRRPRWLKERATYFEDYDDSDFVTHFRLSKTSALSVLSMIEHNLEFTTNRNQAVSPINQLLLALRFYATGGDQLSVADYAGVSQSTASRIVHRVSSAIAALRCQYINLPQTPQSVLQTQMRFYNKARFPKVIGAMDCTHIRIRSPGGNNAELFRNRKTYFSLNVQAICNANMEFSDIVARWPGSSHDSTIFNNCVQRARFEQGIYGDSVLLVDAGYPCRSYLMPPLDIVHTPAENLYNESQIRSRNVIERTFGLWKRRFPVLALGMNVTLDHTFAVITATAVLHNILRRAGEELPQDDPHLQLPAPWAELLGEGQIDGRLYQQNRPISRRDNLVRRTIIDTYFRSLLPQ
ncbi:putative nuclease HARBI1 [Periplaneta americana]|uniref:putative nuclease HARBI1 n=1 Tax=Periplaneta americana TaxID=6978 RepID=UPI0037E75B82